MVFGFFVSSVQLSVVETLSRDTIWDLQHKVNRGKQENYYKHIWFSFCHPYFL